LHTLRDGRLKIAGIGKFHNLGAEGFLQPRQAPPLPVPDGAQFLTRSFACAAGTRRFKLYIPASAASQPRGLVVMLHGCKQDPDDFATGTHMNAVAEAHGLAVAYPAQPGSSNAASCWNWFNPSDQTRDRGEPSIIAGITREIIAEFQIDRSRVFVAGLSAGGAMAAVMGETYPDLYAAVGVHSGLAYGSASDVMSAFAAMRGDVNAISTLAKRRAATSRVRTIVFHGTADQVVHPSNADSIVEVASRHHLAAPFDTDHGSSAGGLDYKRSVITGGDGKPAVECWLIDGAGHAWSGGRPEGSYTDPRGPDASVEMVRFFLA
jgi:poly(hydroxyalkanoate) depolymerase family esterase